MEGEGTSRRLAAFLAASRWEALPDAVRAEAGRAVLNVTGCILAGRREPDFAVLAGALPGEEALLDGAAATSQDYDDTHLRTVIHATPPVAGALFALSRLQPVSGAQLLHGFALGMEVACRIGNAVTPGHYERGWHITSTCGVFGAAVAAAKAMDLDEDGTLAALGIAATQAAGLVESLGSMARILNAGFAARNGLQAAQLAAGGFGGPARPIEGLRGFVNVFGVAKDYGAITGGLGEYWELHKVEYKPYPCGVVLHALLDACIGLHAQRGAVADADIRIGLHPLAIERADRPAPRNVSEARLSVQHAAAVALLTGSAGAAAFSDAALADPAVLALRARVTVTADATLDKMGATLSVGGAPALRIEGPARMDDARLEAKFRELARGEADELIALVRGLDRAPDAAVLTRRLARPPRP
jgi:2-methylcitrate dehydratase PrpD